MIAVIVNIDGLVHDSSISIVNAIDMKYLTIRCHNFDNV